MKTNLSIQVDLVLRLLSQPSIEVKNGLSEILEQYVMILYWADLRLHYCFVVKSGTFYILYALACFFVISVTVTFPLGLIEMVNRGLLSELGIEWFMGESPYRCWAMGRC